MGLLFFFVFRNFIFFFIMNVWRSFGLLSRASILRSYAPMNASMYPITNSVLTYNQADLSQDPLPSCKNSSHKSIHIVSH